jgi:hypothetical protein
MFSNHSILHFSFLFGFIMIPVFHLQSEDTDTVLIPSNISVFFFFFLVKDGAKIVLRTNSTLTKKSQSCQRLALL